ncbi:hypothetical protein ADS77_00945 [Pseudoalteromonas porphyrae]|uniref:Uncharacterized protein n=1 Tax=Pseudoalteromonas porphyrae TaxID=187330 RepID=A0A0N1EP34_9GAMM|nr:hypothetical protein ADS77_00945 [Pseudoalteromonas porphyrae]
MIALCIYCRAKARPTKVLGFVVGGGFTPRKLKHHKMQTARGKLAPTGLVYFSSTSSTNNHS